MSESKWISVHKRLPLETKRYLIAVRRDVTEAVFHAGTKEWETCAGGIRVAAEYWMDLPLAPPRQSSFEKWWDAHREDLVTEMMQCPRMAANEVWDAALKAVQSPDYVP